MASYTIQTETLEILAMAPHYNRWILKSFQSILGERVLEIGCGLGTFTELLLRHCRHVTALDIFPHYIETIEQRLNIPPGKTLDTRCLNILDFKNTATSELGTFDTIVMLNVLEHIEDHVAALQILRHHLNPGGRVVLLVPALQALYSDYDRSIHHHRRYTKQSLQTALLESGLHPQKLQYFNFAGIFGWWFNFCLLKRTTMTSGSVGIFNKISPYLQKIEDWVPPPVGLSLIAIASV